VKSYLTLIAATALISAAAGAQELEPGVQTSSSAAPAQRTQPAAANQQAPKPKPASAPAAANETPKGKSSDKIELDTTQISGNRELPKVMYVVPWRRADPGDFAGKPPNSLLDEALTPVDRDVFRRQNHYYGAVQAGAAQAAAGTTAPNPKDEK